MEKLLADEAIGGLKLSDPEDLEQSNMLRHNGNALYKDGKLEAGSWTSISNEIFNSLSDDL